MNFPTSIDTALTLLTAVNNLVTSLDGALAADANGNQSSATRIYVASTTNFPASGDIIIGNETEGFEVVSYTSKAATYFDGITRGSDGTVSIVHATGVNVKNGINAHYHNLIRDALITIEQYLFDVYHHITILPINYSGITQGTWAFSANTGNVMARVVENSTHADADQIDYKVGVTAGTYSFRVIFSKDTDAGKFDLLVDGVSKGTADGYGLTLLRGNIFNVTGVAMTGGVHTISIKLNGTSGTNHYAYLDSIALWRTA